LIKLSYVARQVGNPNAAHRLDARHVLPQSDELPVASLPLDHLRFDVRNSWSPERAASERPSIRTFTRPFDRMR